MGDRLTTNQQLGQNQSITSQNGRYSVVMQGDGNLALNDGGRGIWGAGTNGKGGDHAVMQDDGNFVIYTSSGAPVWASNTPGHPGAFVVVQNDGNVVVYDPSNHPLWASQNNNGGLFGNIASAIGSIIPKQAQAGFQQAVAISQKGVNLSPANIASLVSALSPANQQGFHAAVALKTATASPQFAAHMGSFGPGDLSHLQLGGFAMGMAHLPPMIQAAVASNPQVASGLALHAAKTKSVWRKIGEALHLLKKT